jgi:NAD(P)-dependent dehydrogenase (short-subunit alcohol dehydrogenase family)
MNGVALITGSSRGIGRGIALELAAAGRHHLVINYATNEAAAHECAALCREKCHHDVRIELLQGDVSVAPHRKRIVEFVRSSFGRLDLLVNNAGVAPLARADLLEASEESFDRLIAINLKGPYFLTQTAAPLLRESPPIAGLARAVVNITSISAFTASTDRGDYCVTKAGLSMMTKLYAARLAEYDIGVFEVQPGVIATDMTAPVKAKYDALFADGLAPIARWGKTDEVGKCVAAIALGHFPYSTGQVFQVDGGFHLRTL